MRDSETLRTLYNERFKNSNNKWGSENINYCIKIAKKVAKWIKLDKNKKYKILDVGCATGYYTKAFSLMGMDAYGLDYSDVAIDKAKQLHPECHFIHMDGFNPNFNEPFDIIFCKGFSGANTHDLEFVAQWVNKYVAVTSTGGYFVLSYQSNFSGYEKDDETVNWSRKEINHFATLVNAEYKGLFVNYSLGIISQCYALYLRFLGKRKKFNYFVIFKKE